MGVPLWKPRSRQQEGLATEQQVVKQLGGRPHPRSGAGSIKHDGSTEDVLIEVKDAMRAHTLSGVYLLAFFRQAVRQGKQPCYIVRFTNGITCTIAVHQEKRP